MTEHIREKAQALIDVKNSWYPINQTRRFLRACDEFCAAYIETFKAQPFIVHYMGEEVQFDISRLDINIKSEMAVLPPDCNAAVEDDTQTILINENIYLGRKTPENIAAELFYVLPHEVTHVIQNYLILHQAELDLSKLQSDYLRQLEINRADNFRSIFFGEDISLRITGIPFQSIQLQELNNAFYSLGLFERDAFIYEEIVGSEIAEALGIYNEIKHTVFEKRLDVFSSYLRIEKENAFLYLDTANNALTSNIILEDFESANIEYTMAAIGLSVNRYYNGKPYENNLSKNLKDGESVLSEFGILVSYPHKIDNDRELSWKIITQKENFDNLTDREQSDNLYTVISALMSGTAEPENIHVWPEIVDYLLKNSSFFSETALSYIKENCPYYLEKGLFLLSESQNNNRTFDLF